MGVMSGCRILAETGSKRSRAVLLEKPVRMENVCPPVPEDYVIHATLATTACQDMYVRAGLTQKFIFVRVAVMIHGATASALVITIAQPVQITVYPTHIWNVEAEMSGPVTPAEAG